MEKLVATFSVELPWELLVYRPENDKLCYQVWIDGFDVEIGLVTGDQSRISRTISEAYETHGVRLVSISVSRDEHEEPPVVATSTSEGDYVARWNYFDQRLPEYQQAAVTVLNRLILFFKYRLHAPLLRELNVHDQGFQDPKWTDELGRKIGRGTVELLLPPIPGLGSLSFGVVQLSPVEDQDLQGALSNPLTPRLYEELLSDAQAAALQGNLRRAVLETAIACEVAAKQAYFATNTLAGVVFDVLENRRHVEVTVLDLIHSVAQEAFGESFKKTNEQDYTNIDYLFRCRNKVAHKGELRYRDDKRAWHEVDRGVLYSWWVSARELVSWLDVRVAAYR